MNLTEVIQDIHGLDAQLYQLESCYGLLSTVSSLTPTITISYLFNYARPPARVKTRPLVPPLPDRNSMDNNFHVDINTFYVYDYG